MITLRYVATVAPNEMDWLKKLISVFNGHYFNKRRSRGVLLYFWLCLADMPTPLAQPEILRYRDHVIPLLDRKPRKNEDSDNYALEKYMISNTFAF